MSIKKGADWLLCDWWVDDCYVEYVLALVLLSGASICLLNGLFSMVRGRWKVAGLKRLVCLSLYRLHMVRLLRTWVVSLSVSLI